MRWLLLLSLVACSPPRRIVVLDKGLLADSRAAVEEVESELGCDMWDRPTTRARPLDDIGPMPTFNTITVEWADIAPREGEATPGWPEARCRVRINKGASEPVFGHEFLHCMGEEHQDSGIMAERIPPGWDLNWFSTPASYIERLARRYCR